MGELHFEDILTGWPLLSKGLLYTLVLGLVSFAGGLAGGTVLGLLREENRGPAGRLAACYIELMRGIPLILFLVFIHYGLMPLVFRHSNFLTSSLLAFILFESAYIGEIIRSGLKAVSRPEREAAVSLGMTYPQRLWHVILPLAYSRMMPALIGQFITLIKDTSLASIVGVVELTRAGEIIYEQTFHDFEILLFVATVYYLICFTLARLGKRFETPEARMENLMARSMQAG